MAALKDWQNHRLYLAIDTTVLWNRLYDSHISSLLWSGNSLVMASLGTRKRNGSIYEYQPLLRKARWLLRHHPDVMVLADRGFANHDF